MQLIIWTHALCLKSAPLKGLSAPFVQTNTKSLALKGLMMDNDHGIYPKLMSSPKGNLRVLNYDVNHIIDY